MGNKLKYERFLWFHKRIKDEKYPNARLLAEGAMDEIDETTKKGGKRSPPCREGCGHAV